MTFLSTQPKEERQQLQVLAQTPGDREAFEPGLFEGSGTAALVGAGRVGAIANQLVGEAGYQVGALFSRPVDALFDTNFTNELDRYLRQAPATVTADMTPDPYTTGTIGQILYSLVGVGVPAAAGTVFGGPVGGAALAGSFTAVGTATDLTQQGVDPGTAAGAALFEGGLMAAGVGLPAAIGGKVALNTLLYGPGVNVAQSIIAGQGTGAWLESQGYSELADRYATYDAEMLAADIVLGAAFGYAGARGARVPREPIARPSTAVVDTAHVALDQRHIEVDTAPGIPANLAAVKSHNANLQAATEALLDGRQVVTAPPEGAFVPKPPNPAYSDSALVRAFQESGYPELLAEVKALEDELTARGIESPDAPLPGIPEPATAATTGTEGAAAPAQPARAAIPRDNRLQGEDAAIQDRMAAEITADVVGSIRRYAALREAEGGKVLNTDLARELSGDYRADRTRSAAVHEPASWLVKEMYRRKLRQAPKGKEKPVVLFTAGGTGAGKTTAIEGTPAVRRIKAQAQIVYDTNMNGFQSSSTKIDQALKAGKKVHIAFVVRDPVEALVQGALPRAERMGRTVPLSEHAKTHIGAAETLQKLAQKYQGNKNVKFSVIDNTQGKGKARVADVAFSATMDYTDLAGRLRKALDKEYERGAISESVYRGTAGVDAASAGLRRTADAAGAGAGAADGRAVRTGLPGAQRADGRGNGAEPERQDGESPTLTRAAADAVAETPDLSVVDGAGDTVPAAALLADADLEIARAEQDAPGFEAAVACFLRRGA